MLAIVSSQNPVKIRATELAFTEAFPQENFTFQGISVPSGVSDQPMTEEETLLGARNRVQAAREKHPEADYWIGIEGGLHPMETGLQAMAWVVVQGKESRGEGRSCGFMLPPEVNELLAQGLELGHAIDKLTGDTNTAKKGGAVGMLTGGLITRTTLYVPAVTLALIPFLGGE